MNTAKNKEHYIKVWNSHIDSLNGLQFPLMDASKGKSYSYYAEIKEIQQRLKELIELAANNEFPENDLEI
jgi:hypothetical protein